ncbi:MAG TPA: short-chain dehydrogenase, partial [Leclercia adecarboxylata]|nr:short-chain dehydrogenase [Leclercia adecarboxylata]
MTRNSAEILTGKVMQKSVLITGCSSGIGLE